MPRAGQLKPPAGERLPDRIAIGLLTVTFPPELVDRVVAEAGRVQRPRGEGAGAFPQVRVAALGECGTHAVFAAELGPLAVHETELARRLLGHLRAGMLLIADRGFAGFDLWRAAAATGADLLWRVKNSAVLPVAEQLADGSYLSHIYAARDKRRHADPARVRVIEYTLAGQAARYRLITTINE